MKVALGSFLGIIAVIVLLAAMGHIGVDGVVIFALLILAILVGVGAFRSQLR